MVCFRALLAVLALSSGVFPIKPPEGHVAKPNINQAHLFQDPRGSFGSVERGQTSFGNEYVLPKRRTPTLVPRWSPKSEQTKSHDAKAAAPHLVEVYRRSPPVQFNVWQQPTAEQPMTIPGLRQDDVGALAIKNFLRLNQQLFLPVPRSPETLQGLAGVYRPYQDAHPLRGSALDLSNSVELVDQVWYNSGRDRIRDMDTVLSHLIRNKQRLGLDDIRVSYIEALQRRFVRTKKLLTPTVPEIISRGQEEARRPFRIENIAQVLDIRTTLALNNHERFSLDLGLLQMLEEELDRLVRGADTRMATGMHMIRRDASGPGPGAGQPSNTAPLMSTEEFLTRFGMARNEPGAESIAEFQVRNERLLRPVLQAPEHEQHLANMYRTYREQVPVRGQALNLDDAWFLYGLLKNDVGRDRFRKISPIISHLLAHRDAFRLDRRRVNYLQALHERFADTATRMSPTLDDLTREGEELRNRFRSGRFAPGMYQAMLQALHSRREERIQLGLREALRFTHDLKLIKHLEIDLEGFTGRIQPVTQTARRLVPRRISQKAEEEAKTGTFVRRNDPHTDAEKRFILGPLGMNLADPHAEPIAVWRLSEHSLADRPIVSPDSKAILRGRWLIHRRRFQQIPLYFDRLSEQARLDEFLKTDAGERFGSVNNVIQFLLGSKEKFRLSTEEINYLHALKSRFEVTHRLMQPMPSKISSEVRADYPNATPRAQEVTVQDRWRWRNMRIRSEARRIAIDTRLLDSFESEVDFLHGILPLRKP